MLRFAVAWLSVEVIVCKGEPIQFHSRANISKPELRPDITPADPPLLRQDESALFRTKVHKADRRCSETRLKKRSERLDLLQTWSDATTVRRKKTVRHQQFRSEHIRLIFLLFPKSPPAVEISYSTRCTVLPSMEFKMPNFVRNRESPPTFVRRSIPNADDTSHARSY